MAQSVVFETLRNVIGPVRGWRNTSTTIATPSFFLVHPLNDRTRFRLPSLTPVSTGAQEAVTGTSG
jgi:hypothetical protein